MSLTESTYKNDLISHKTEQAGIYRDNYNRKPFAFEHTLDRNPLFELPTLVRLAERMAPIPGRVYYTVGDRGVNQGWDLSSERAFSWQEALEKISSAEAWMILKGAQAIPEYAEILQTFLRQVHDLSGQRLEQATKDHNISVIITSPGRLTPYHMDRDCNYLLQIKGAKTIHVFDGSDPDVVTSKELEDFYAGNMNAASYRESSQPKAESFHLTPGMGVHVPVTFPHWVKNDDNVSISASINFCFVDPLVPNVYRINKYLRRAGLKPKRLGRSALGDSLKTAAAKLLAR